MFLISPGYRVLGGAALTATLAGALTAPLVLAGSGRAAAGDGDRPLVIATTSIWADVVDQLDCADELSVVTLVPPGADPHGYEPSMQDRDLLAGATLVVANGAGLEGALADTLDAVADDAAVFSVADHVTTHAADDGDDAVDPHVWLDPTLVAEALPELADALVTAGADPAVIEGCHGDLAASLEALDAELAGVVESLPAERRVLVTNHDALGYLARRYGFTILGTVLPSTSTLVEASPGELDELAAAIEGAGVPAIFAEALEATDDATALADRLGVRVVTLYTDSLGEPGSGADSYQAMMRHDVHAIVDALR